MEGPRNSSGSLLGDPATDPRWFARASHRVARSRSSPTLTWIDWYYKRVPLPYLSTTVLSGIALFVAGLAVSLVNGVSDLYLEAPPVYLGAIGFALVVGSTRWVTSRFPSILVEIRPCFRVDERLYRRFAREWLDRASSNRRFWFFACAFIVLAVGVAYVGAVQPDIFQRYGIQSIRPSLFPSAWFARGDATLAIVIVYAIACGLALITGMWLLATNVPFLLRLQRFGVIPVPASIVARFHRMTEIYLMTSFTWALGVLLFAILFVRNADAASMVLLLVLGAFGLVTFFLPQWVINNFLMKSNDSIAEGARLIYESHFHGHSGNDIARAHLRQDTSMSYWEFVSLAADAAQGPRWVYDISDAVVVVLAQLLPVAAVAAQAFFH
jgi:hypothetical protein